MWDLPGSDGYVLAPTAPVCWLEGLSVSGIDHPVSFTPWATLHIIVAGNLVALVDVQHCT